MVGWWGGGVVVWMVWMVVVWDWVAQLPAVELAAVVVVSAG